MKEEMPPLPEEFKSRIRAQFGVEEGDKLLMVLDCPPSVSLRLNPLKLTESQLPYPDMEQVEWAPDGWRLQDRPRFTDHPWLHGGGFYVQESSSMWISALMERVAEEEGTRRLRVLDLCAAPGGKSVGVASALGKEALVVSNEVDPRRVSVLAENMTKWGHPGSVVTSGSAADWGEAAGWFDVLVADVPCSGEGMMRKEKIARTQWSERLVAQCAALQRSILEDALPALRPGGWLVYSTCTFNREENEENLEWLEREHGLKTLCGPRRFLPGRDGGEGLFMALLRKEGYGERSQLPDGIHVGKKKGDKGDKTARKPVLMEQAKKWLSTDRDWIWKTEGGKITAMDADWAVLYGRLPRGIRVLKAGVDVAEVKGCDLVPEHQLGVSAAMRAGAFPTAELDLEQAQKYLLRESVALPDGTPKGYVAVAYRGVRLGFVKNLGHRANNLYPKEWKIRHLG